MVQVHICPPLPLLQCSYHHHDHHVIHWCWKHHMWQTHHLHVLKNQCQHPSKCLAEFSLHGRHHPFLQYWSLSRRWCWIHAPLKKFITIDCVTCCQANTVNCMARKTYIFSCPLHVPQPHSFSCCFLRQCIKHCYDAQTKMLSYTLVQLCGLYTTYTFLKNDVLCRWAAQLSKKKSFHLSNPRRLQVH